MKLFKVNINVEFVLASSDSLLYERWDESDILSALGEHLDVGDIEGIEVTRIRTLDELPSGWVGGVPYGDAEHTTCEEILKDDLQEEKEALVDRLLSQGAIKSEEKSVLLYQGE